jgi:hypothetical protein
MKSGSDETLADPEARIAPVGQAATKFTECKNSLWMPFFWQKAVFWMPSMPIITDNPAGRPPIFASRGLQSVICVTWRKRNSFKITALMNSYEMWNFHEGGRRIKRDRNINLRNQSKWRAFLALWRRGLQFSKTHSKCVSFLCVRGPRNTFIFF